MAKINILDSFVYNRIAAGEVVERPFSVVKELVENSIDAGAKNILIEIVDGGVTSIKIKDDGFGIEKSELKSALLPHATSKIKDADDLDSIQTLGFRGEALASIASVSKINIASKPENQDFGAKIYAEGGNIKEVVDCGASDGTEIIVNNLFYNTPARQKFLKSFKSEESDVTNLVTRFILGNPDIAFKYVANEKCVYQSFGDGLESAMICVYGASVINDCFCIDTQKNGIAINGYIGKHYFTKGNRTYQSVFLNGRYIINSTISSAIANAYGAYLMKRQYPFYVLNITVPVETVDVNVHPNKADVRFSNNQVIYGSVYSVISKVLDGSSEIVNIIKEEPKKIQEFTNETKIDYATHNSEEYPKSAPISKTFTFNDVSVDKKNNAVKFEEIEKSISDTEVPKVDVFDENKKYIESLIEKKNEVSTQQILQTPIELRLVGQALSTFLIFDDGTDLYFVDQHAAHERILYDKFMENAKNSAISTQPLLVPYVFTVNSQENDFIVTKLEYFKQLGFDIDEFGYNTFKISALPFEVCDMDIKSFIDDLIADMNFFKNESLPELIKDKIATKACRAAIKSGDKLDEKDIEILLDLMKGNLALKCPHGRPVAIKITRTEIDKWFKRIV